MEREGQARPQRRLVLVLEYDGAAYSGSQLQKNAPSIQGELEEALAKLTGEAARVKMAGRTDAGVHARGQVASFLTMANYTAETIVKALNYHLPQDMAIKAAAEVAVDFDVRRHALSRFYRYTIYNGPQRSPLWASYSWHIPSLLDAVAMQEAAKCLVGCHNLASFTAAAGVPTMRTVLRAEVYRRGQLVQLEMEADAFLPRQVRRTTGALAQVGLGRLCVAEFRRLVEEPQPGDAGPTAPPQGLCLIGVRYQGVEFGDGFEEDDANL